MSLFIVRTICLFALVSCAAHAQRQEMAVATPPPASDDLQSQDDLLAGTERFAKGAVDVSEVNLDSDGLGMVAGNADGGLAKKMNYMAVRSYRYDKPGMYNMDNFLTIRKRLDDGSWTCSVHVHTRDSSTDICARPAGKGEPKETVIMTASPKEVSFIHMKGRASLNDLGRLGQPPSTPKPPDPPRP